MNPINTNNVKIKNLICLIDNPTHEDLLFEIVFFLDSEKRYDGKFSVKEVSLKTHSRISGELSSDIEKLEELGFIKKEKYNNYILIKHIWE